MGMLVYANDAPGFTAVLKQRYSDFIVNEVTKEGKVVRLTKLHVDKKGNEVQEKEQGEEGKKRIRTEEGRAMAEEVEAGAGTTEPEAAATAARENDTPTKAAKAIAELGDAGHWPEDIRQRLVIELTALLLGKEVEEDGKEKDEEAVVTKKEKEGEERFRRRKSAMRGTPRQVVFPPTADKALRRRQHQYFKEHFRGVVEGDTVDPTLTAMEKEGGKEERGAAGGMKCVRIVKVGEGKRTGCWKGYVGATSSSSSTSSYGPQKRGRDGGRDGGEGSSYGREEYRPKYLYFALYKENHTTTSAIAALAKTLRVKENRFSIAGMKDKRGLTTQQVWIEPLSLPSLPPSLLPFLLFPFQAGSASVSRSFLNFPLVLPPFPPPSLPPSFH